MRGVCTLYVTPRKQMYRYGAAEYICTYVRTGYKNHCIFKCIRIKNEMG